MNAPLPAPEFSRVIRLTDVGGPKKIYEYEATREECTALAERFSIPEIRSLEVNCTLEPQGDKITCAGKISADISQFCTISGDTFSTKTSEKFNILFAPEIIEDAPAGSEIELASEDCDQMVYDGKQVDIGEAAAQTLFLSLDLYPRGPNADKVAAEKGLKSEEQAGPFGALAALKDQLSSKKT